MNRVKELFRGPNELDWCTSNDQAYDIPAIYMHDDSDAARIYHHSKRAAEKFSALSSNAKYYMGLLVARYAQSPFNEFAALGPDTITAISGFAGRRLGTW